MAAAAGLLNHQSVAHPMATPMTSSSSGTNGSGSSSSASDDSATISANDFLTLLVTEMQNQDPTADTDPNEYINQLVQCKQPGAADRHQPDADHGLWHFGDDFDRCVRVGWIRIAASSQRGGRPPGRRRNCDLIRSYSGVTRLPSQPDRWCRLPVTSACLPPIPAPSSWRIRWAGARGRIPLRRRPHFPEEFSPPAIWSAPNFEPH